MTQTDESSGLIAVGASAGGVEALTRMVSGLPSDLQQPVLVVLHMPAGAPSALARILDRAGPLPSAHATDGAELKPGTIFVSVPDRHLLVDDHRIRLTEGPTEDGHRPAINALFRSAALAYGPRAISVLLSGVLDDGVLGSAAIKSRGGVTIAQTPSDAMFPAMPANAVAAGVIDHQVPVTEIGGLIATLTGRNVEEHEMEPDPSMELENRIAMAARFATDFDTETLGPPSGYICPDCNGSLAAVGPGNYRCRVGHAWTPDALLRARDEEVERAVWIALRSLQEKSKLSRRLAQKAGPGLLADRYTDLAAEADHAISVIRERFAAVSQHPEGGDV
ncbi:protein-glutamate methylesterase [Mycolicibacterium porcinum]|uniref:chemotaxis protein CheB n=1 Tax=Mycolicibacterium porcinum TaxID=39693 RepID=UPI00080BD6B5|nr:chemotaxis protein CheB [Mycolicibacterium porcinum]OCB07259.1 protein-glutamate methylesterase [Mycolicibacterium porcinum]